MTLYTEDQRRKLDLAQDILQYRFSNEELLLAAITHPSAVEGKPITCSYERYEFLGDSILGALVADEAFHRYPEIDEGGLTRIKVSLVSGSSLSKVASALGFADFIIFGQSEQGTGRRGLHSALENVFESVVAALYLDGGIESAQAFVARVLLDHMSADMAKEPENPKSVLQEKLQEDGITPTYKLVETQGPPHDRTFVTQVFAGMQALASGIGRTKKESESQAAESALETFFGVDASGQIKPSGLTLAESREQARAAKAQQKAEAKAAKAQQKAEARAAKERKKAEAKAERARQMADWGIGWLGGQDDQEPAREDEQEASDTGSGLQQVDAPGAENEETAQ